MRLGKVLRAEECAGREGSKEGTGGEGSLGGAGGADGEGGEGGGVDAAHTRGATRRGLPDRRGATDSHDVGELGQAPAVVGSEADWRWLCAGCLMANDGVSRARVATRRRRGRQPRALTSPCKEWTLHEGS